MSRHAEASNKVTKSFHENRSFLNLSKNCWLQLSQMDSYIQQRNFVIT